MLLRCLRQLLTSTLNLYCHPRVCLFTSTVYSGSLHNTVRYSILTLISVTMTSQIQYTIQIQMFILLSTLPVRHWKAYTEAA